MTELIISGLIGTSIILGWALWPLNSSVKWWRVGIGVLLFLYIGLAYWFFGGWREYRSHAEALARQEKAQAMLSVMHNPETVIRRLKKHLEQHPQAAKGWYLLGRLYAHQHQWIDAEKSFAIAHQLRPHDVPVALNLAQSLFAKGGVADRRKARQLLESILHKQPTQADALALLAMDAYTQKFYDKAIDYWQRLLLLLPPDSEETKAIQRAIAKARNQER